MIFGFFGTSEIPTVVTSEAVRIAKAVVVIVGMVKAVVVVEAAIFVMVAAARYMQGFVHRGMIRVKR